MQNIITHVEPGNQSQVYEVKEKICSKLCSQTDHGVSHRIGAPRSPSENVELLIPSGNDRCGFTRSPGQGHGAA